MLSAKMDLLMKKIEESSSKKGIEAIVGAKVDLQTQRANTRFKR